MLNVNWRINNMHRTLQNRELASFTACYLFS